MSQKVTATVGEKLHTAINQIVDRFKDPEPAAFVSFGTIVFDDIEYPGGTLIESNLGGEGLWATFGARLFKPKEKSKEIGCLIVIGKRYPHAHALFKMLVKSWNILVVVHVRNNMPINRARVKYACSGHLLRTIRYETPLLTPTASHLGNTRSFLAADSFHFACFLHDAEAQILALNRLREGNGINNHPLIVWQPAHTGGIARELIMFEKNMEKYKALLRLTDVFSLSYHELRDIAGVRNVAHPPAHFFPLMSFETYLRRTIEFLITPIAKSRIGPTGGGVIIIRCEPFGYYYRKWNRVGWVRSYKNHYDYQPVTDFTGAGSAFLGAFSVRFIESGDVVDSCLRSAVAASFAMEQFGLPVMTTCPQQKGDEVHDGELWNHDSAFDRLRVLYRRRER
ncbi:hypothetical protein F4803DRAFT_576689 [Xylaria telfairii]|nr:hypothetical protein F4803DRAFT_576689 [Xylaria telfairii]